MTEPVNINQVPKLNLGLQEADEVFVSRNGSGPYRVPASSFPWEQKGDKGDPGGSWAPVLALVTDGVRRVHRIVGWVGGTGVEPTTTGYIGAAGIVSNVAEAVDVRGLQGTAGWAPVLALVADGDRRVHQIIDWTGGAGAKPGVGWYVGVTGLVELIQDAVNVRGATGGVGWSPVLAVVPDGNRRVQQIVDWIGGAGTKPTALGYVGATGIVATAALAADVSGTQGNAGWAPVLAIVADGERRVQQVVDWVGGAGTKPEPLGYVGVAGIVATAAAAVDTRGPQGVAGWAPVLAVVADGERRVQQVVDWTGGAGTKPETRGYVGAAGIVATAAAAVDVRGSGLVSGENILTGLSGAPSAVVQAIGSLVSGDGAPEKIVAKLQRARMHSTRIVMSNPPVITTSAASFSGFGLGVPSDVTSNAKWTGVVNFWGGFMARSTNRIKPRVATATPITATDPLVTTGFDDGGSGCSFHIDADVFVLFVNTSSLAPFRFSVDELDGNGPRLVSLAGTAPAQTADSYVKMDFTSAGGAKERVIHIEGPQAWAFSRIFLATGSAHKVWSPASADYVRFAINHDSWGFGPVPPHYTTPPPITQDGYVMELVRMLAYRCDIRNSSIGGSGLGVPGNGGKTTFEGRWFDLLDLMPDGVTRRSNWEPEFGLIGGSINNNATDDTVLLAALESIYGNIRARKPVFPLIFAGPPVRPTDSGVGAAVANNELFRLWVAGKVAAGDRRIAFISVSSPDEKWLDGTGYFGATTGNGINDKMIGTDSAHPSYDGHPYYARRLFAGICTALASMA